MEFNNRNTIRVGLFSNRWENIIPQLLHSLNPTIAPSEVDTISLGVFIIATIFSLTTTMISSQKPVKIAMDCSPMKQ